MKSVLKSAFVSDWDGVLFQTEDAFNAFLMAHYGIRIPENTPHCGYSMETLVLSQIPEENRPTLHAFYRHLGSEFLASPHWHKDVEPMEDSVEVVHELAQKFDFFVATARQPVSSVVVESLTGKHFPDIVRGFHYVYTLHDTGSVAVPKRQFFERFEPHRRAGFADDNPKEVRSMQGVAPSFLFDPKGYYTHVTDCERVTSWRSLGDLLL